MRFHHIFPAVSIAQRVINSLHVFTRAQLPLLPAGRSNCCRRTLNIDAELLEQSLGRSATRLRGQIKLFERRELEQFARRLVRVFACEIHLHLFRELKLECHRRTHLRTTLCTSAVRCSAPHPPSTHPQGSLAPLRLSRPPPLIQECG